MERRAMSFHRPQEQRLGGQQLRVRGGHCSGGQQVLQLTCAQRSHLGAVRGARPSTISCGMVTRYKIWRFDSARLRPSCLTCLIIRLIIQTIRRDPSGSVWIDEAPNVSRPDPSGTDQTDAEHQVTYGSDG